MARQSKETPKPTATKRSEESQESSDESDNSSSVSDTSSSDNDTETNNASQKKILAPAFRLSCLKNWDATKMELCFNQFVSKSQRDGSDSPLKFGARKLSSIHDFTPWWDDFTKPLKVSAKTVSSSTSDPDSFHSWFEKEGEGSSRLPAGSGSSKVPKTNVEVEDIEVPSIYEQTPKTKGRRALKKERRAEKDKTLGKGWFDMRAPEVDAALRNDLEMIQMRGALDPKRFYKHNDRRGTPKYFQIGKVQDEGTDFYSSRLTKKQRKGTLVEELLADANVRTYNKRKYAEVQSKMRNKKFKGQGKGQGKKSAAS